MLFFIRLFPEVVTPDHIPTDRGGEKLVEEHADEVEGKEAQKRKPVVFFQEEPPPYRSDWLGEEVEEEGEEEEGDVCTDKSFSERREVNGGEEVEEDT
jgi:hypothetical protein